MYSWDQNRKNNVNTHIVCILQSFTTWQIPNISNDQPGQTLVTGDFGVAILAWQFWQAQGQEHHRTREPQLRRGGDFGKDQILEDVGGPWVFFL